VPTPDAKRQTEEPHHGMDYGVPPRYMLMANPALLELWNQAKCLGLGYRKLPRHGAFFDLPCVGIIFEDTEKGIRIFDLLKSWDCEPCSGRGTDVSFTEDRAANSYMIALGPSTPEMVKRLLDPSMLEDYSLLTMGFAVGKTLTLSEHFRWLRDQPRSKPIVFVPGAKSGELLVRHALLKADVQFFDKKSVPKETVEYAMCREDRESTEPRPMQPPPVDSVQISQRRARQLKRFFAVATARLEHNPTFLKAVERLSQDYERWQLIQATCNILCGDWFPELRAANGKLDFDKAYDALRQRPEPVIDESALRRHFSAEAIEAQVGEDVLYLRDQLRPEAKSDKPIVILRQLGLLR
jgi:hypothetical protein